MTEFIYIFCFLHCPDIKERQTNDFLLAKIYTYMLSLGIIKNYIRNAFPVIMITTTMRVLLMF